MHFSHATILAALAANVLATPVPQVGGEAQACQGVAQGVTNGVGGASETTLDKVAAAKRWIALYRRQGTGAANACYDIVNNVDQGVGYTTGSLLSGAAGDKQDEVTGQSAVGNTDSSGGSSGGSSAPPPPPPAGGNPPPPNKRQVADIDAGVDAVANKAGLGQATQGVTGAATNAADESNNDLTNVGAEIGTEEASPTSTLGGEIGNSIYDTTHGAGAKRQLNKIATGEQDLAESVGLGSEDEPLYDAENTIDGDGTSGVGNAGKSAGNTISSTLNGGANAIP